MNNSFQVVDDLLDEEALERLNSLLLSRDFPFYWHDDIDEENRKEDVKNFGFSHELFNGSKGMISSYIPAFEEMLHTMCNKFDTSIPKLLRLRVVLLTNVGEEHLNKTHVDLDGDNFCTLVFYPHDTDGDFFWFDDDGEHKVDVKKNTCVFMSGRIPHHGSMPVNHSRRIAINANFSL